MHATSARCLWIFFLKFSLGWRFIEKFFLMIFAALGQRQIFRSFSKTKVTESHLIYATIDWTIYFAFTKASLWHYSKESLYIKKLTLSGEKKHSLHTHDVILGRSYFWEKAVQIVRLFWKRGTPFRIHRKLSFCFFMHNSRVIWRFSVTSHPFTCMCVIREHLFSNFTLLEFLFCLLFNPPKNEHWMSNTPSIA